MLSNEQIQESWWNYLKKMFPPLPGHRLPYLFSDPYCATCTYWFLIDYDGLYHLDITSSPSEYDDIVNDLKGNHIFAYRVMVKWKIRILITVSTVGANVSSPSNVAGTPS